MRQPPKGTGASPTVTPPKPELTDAQVKTAVPDAALAHVTFETGGGGPVRATLLRLTRHALAFEVYNPAWIPQLSENLKDFKVIGPAGRLYSGHAVIRSLINTGTKVVCEVAIDEKAWQELALHPDGTAPKNIRGGFQEFLNGWQKFYRVGNDYKIVIADLHSFLTDVRLWLDKLELELSSLPAKERLQREQGYALELREPVLRALNGLFDRFEEISDQIEPDLLPVHRAYGQRLLHPFLLSSPFLHRTYAKPLGYAGDYEMMNMIVRNQMNGGSLFAKFMDAFLLVQAAPQAVRNRVGFLHDRIVAETGRAARLGRKAKIFSVACGPAWEAVNFLAEHPLADHADIEFMDFEAETLRNVAAQVDAVKRKNHCQATVKFTKNSVQNLLRAGGRAAPPEGQFDLVYCSGLYDYLNDQVCQTLNNCFYHFLKPGGLMVVGNFSPDTRHQNIMEHFAEWFLIYRNSQELAALSPALAPKDYCVVRAESTGTNLFLEVRKPSS
ncbi:MAG: methyltransferase domain-containing protein [Verrucomicrobiae bacterium]|nr:methyltransferase domain-containing protein [Verrucomicrobiae bacterium]